MMSSQDWAVLMSLSSLLLVEITQKVQDESIMSAVSAASAIILCLTAVIKFVDLCIEKYYKWKKKKSED